MLNRLFQSYTSFAKTKWNLKAGELLSRAGAQNTLIGALQREENERLRTFKMEHKESVTTDILEKAIIKAKIAYMKQAITAVEYYRRVERVKALRKLRFTQYYEKHQDEDLFEWMKHKVAAEIGGEEQVEELMGREREAFMKLEQSYRATKGDHYLTLWREGAAKDPQANRILPFM